MLIAELRSPYHAQQSAVAMPIHICGREARVDCRPERASPFIPNVRREPHASFVVFVGRGVCPQHPSAAIGPARGMSSALCFQLQSESAVQYCCCRDADQSSAAERPGRTSLHDWASRRPCPAAGNRTCVETFGQVAAACQSTSTATVGPAGAHTCRSYA